MAENNTSNNEPSAVVESSAVVPVEAVTTVTTVTEVPEKKVPRYYNPMCVPSSVKSKSYASSVVSSQSMMLENLRWMRRELEKEDRELDRIQKDMYLSQYPRKWTNYRHYEDKDEDV